MSQEKGLNIMFPEGFNQEKFELTVVNREGDAAKIKDYEQKASFNVAIGSLFTYVEGGKYGKTPQENTGVVTYNYDKRTVVFNVNPSLSNSTVISSKLELHPDLLKLRVNKGDAFNAKALEKLVREVAHIFADPSQPAKLIKQLQNHEVKFESNYKSEDDRKGNSSVYKNSILKMVEGELNLSWDIKTPIFKGTKPVQFTIDIEIDVDNSMPYYSFWSIGLTQLIDNTSSELIAAEVEKFKKQFICLEVVE